MNEKYFFKNDITRRRFLHLAAGMVAASMLPSCCGVRYESPRLQNVQNSPNYKNGVFVNPVPTTTFAESNYLSVFWRWIRKKNSLLEPSRPLNFKSDIIGPTPPCNQGLRVMWMGHSTILLEIDGKRFITDPMLSSRASPGGPFGPARFFESPMKADQMPKIDGVIISHDHFDHLDRPTIKELGRTGVMFYVPLGVGHYLDSWDIPDNQITELDWWDQVSIGEDHALVATPARHFSGRALFGRKRTLWFSFVIRGKQHRVFFGGDGGMWPGFKTIGEKYGPFDISFLEVGGYNFDWKNVHMFPEEAVAAQLNLGGSVLLPIHWGTFNLAFHTWTEPVERLITAAEENNVKLSLPRPGQIVSLPDICVNSGWWKDET